MSKITNQVVLIHKRENSDTYAVAITSGSQDYHDAVLMATMEADMTGEKWGHEVNEATYGKQLTITLPDITSKAFWSGTGKSETFHPETYKRQVKEAIERSCVIAGIGVEVK
ncbi:ATPase [Salmonella enterica subsp. enterica]|uniref:ATPase n=5 Tax=Salmonella enterica TaxID=28901 RepID=A0A5Y2QQB8_SALER|nr:hypothetical protein [Salmonella enterica]EAA4489748.1 ATPase [Salmonella enterica subsp. enterica]EAC1085472.1 ATPase [Salmonella enterica subsp. enterica serovar Newport]EAM1807836.1 ATPase [Salmonella enterica subsp. enterica serovar Senftenberg]EAP4751677.1 ATPase [Salmonella enterica subsp. enterica serovar Meleagridis]EAV4041666.1 ATPase [Salmonella enterica subsp. enterica serovar Uganda]EBC8952133.1 ATPase [Salmonella enterica subsp. enterica serovar Bareilly]EBD6821006.1 ATPase [